MTAVSEQIGSWVNEFTRQAPAAPWVQQLREAAFQRFVDLGFPTTRNEEWRFTNVSAIARENFAVALPAGVNGVSDEAKQHLAKYASFDQNPFVALNTAFLNRVAVFHVPAGKVLEEPIEITYEATADAATHPRTLILVGANAQCRIVETYKGQGRYLTNAVTEVVAGEGAVVDHYKIQQEDTRAFHIATMQ